MDVTSARYELMWVDCGSDGRAHTRRPRTGIRSHAMKLAAAARKGRGYGQQNRGQDAPPLTSLQRATGGPSSPDRAHAHHHEAAASTTTTTTTSTTTTTKRRPPQSRPPAPSSSVPRSLSLVGLERLRADTGMDIMVLAGVTTYHVGQSMSALLHDEPARRALLLGRRRPSYLVHVPPRYGGHSACLDDAVRCVAMKAKRRLLSDHDDAAAPSVELAAYGRALRSLRQAVEQGHHLTQPDVICANQLLSLAEILDFRVDAWQHHTEASARLFMARGPQRIQSKFEKDLLASMLGIFVCEALRTGRPCFLAEKRWQDACDSLVDPTCPEGHYRSANTLVNLKLASRLPGLMGRVPDIVRNPDRYPDQDIEDLEAQLRDIEAQMAVPITSNEALVTEASHGGLPAQHLDERLEMLVGYYTLPMLIFRTLSAISGKRRVADEETCVMYATNVRKLHKVAEKVNRSTSLYLEQISGWTDAIFDTTDDWLAPSAEPRRVIEPWKFQKWKNAMNGGTSS